MARLAGMLAKKEIAIFSISTFDTDYILVRYKDVVKARKGFEEEGIKVDIVTA